MKNYICTTCGAQYSASAQIPPRCEICTDERQYINHNGQTWTTIEEELPKHKIEIKPYEENLYGIGVKPRFAIGQRALLIKTDKGNLLWDCIPFVNQEIKDQVNKLGGIDAIAISHPHYYTGMIEWSKAFGNIPIYLHADDRKWVMRPDPLIHYWEGELLPLFDKLTLIRCSGHFTGASVVHWPKGASGKGILCTGDVIQVIPDRRFVSFMYSYPNLIPLPISSIEKIVKAVTPFEFDRIYGAWWDYVVPSNAKKAVELSAKRYIKAITG